MISRFLVLGIHSANLMFVYFCVTYICIIIAILLSMNILHRLFLYFNACTSHILQDVLVSVGLPSTSCFMICDWSKQ